MVMMNRMGMKNRDEEERISQWHLVSKKLERGRESEI